jgi:DNA polymerase
MIEESEDSLELVAEEIKGCKACALGESRTLAVPGEGVENPLVMVIGEGPGADEDRAGRPFVGRAGQLLDKMLESIGLSREKNCYIANMVKCRPPGNRDPGQEEMAACFPFLSRQILLLQPRLILCLGRVATQYLLNTSQGINTLRGKFTELEIEEIIIPVLPTFHPSALLREESLKRPAWEDLKLLKSRFVSLNEE